MIQDKIFFDEKDPTGVSYNTPFTVYGSYEGRLWSKTPSGTIKYYTQNSDLSVYATTGSNSFNGNQTVTGSLTVTEGITGSATTASYVEYAGVANKPTLVSGSEQVSFNGIVDKPTLVSGSSQITYSGLSSIPAGIVSSSAQVRGYGIFATTGSNQFNGSQAVTGSLTVTGQVVAQTLNVQQVTSSIVFSSGSNIFGNDLGNTQQFTGSLQVSGSSHYVLGNTGIGTTSPSANLHVVRANDGGSGTPAVILSTGNGANDIVRFQDGTTTVAVVKNDGSIGIGTGSPGERLTIRSVATSSAPQLKLENPVDSNSSQGAANNLSAGQLLFGATGAFPLTARIESIYNSDASFGRSADLIFSGTNGSGTLSERMRITAGGSIEVRGGAILNIYRTDNTRALQLYTTINECVIDSWAASSEPLMLRSNGSGGRIVFHTNDGERVRITSGGNVGIGTDNPVAALNVSNVPSSFYGIIETTGTSAGTVKHFRVHKPFYVEYGIGILADNSFHISTASTFPTTNGFTITSAGNVGINKTIPDGNSKLDVNGQAFVAHLAIYNDNGTPTLGTSPMLYSPASATLAISTGATERMRITSGGYLKASNTGTYFGSTSAYHEINSNQADAGTLLIQDYSASPYGLEVYYRNAAPNNSGFSFLYCEDNTPAQRAAIRSNGGLANYQANNVNLSDERTKKDIEPLESYWDKFKNIEIVKFKYKDQTHDDFNIGIIAQQLEAVAPEFVDIDGWDEKPKLDEEGNTIVSEEDPLKSIYTADLHHATIKVLQEAMAKIESLEALLQRNNIS